MFTASLIVDRIRERPFVPLRVVTSGGQSIDVTHPELMMVGQRDVMIGMASAKNPSIYQQVTRVAIMHITALEDLAVPPKSDGNGSNH